MTDVPHLDYPFRLSASGHALVNEQDSIEDIESCLQTILLTERGARIELPEFGIDSPLFGRQPLALEALYQTLVEQEPRALAIISQSPDPRNYLTALIEIDVSAVNPTIGES